MKIGYARVSTREQNLNLQVIALEEASCKKIYEEVISGAKADRPILNHLAIVPDPYRDAQLQLDA